MKNLVRKYWVKKAEGDKSPRVTKKGFSLVEILIVIAVIGILFVALVPKIDFVGDKARETGVKTDFRSFELAAEQLMREKGGIASYSSVSDLCGSNGINLYLDEAVQFSYDATSSVASCAKNDQWNQKYTVQMVKKSGDTNPNNGAIIFICNGKDSDLSTDDDNYVLAVTFVNGLISAETTGFSSDILSDDIEVSADDTASMSYDASTGAAVLTYANE